jgi:hypothetical protein
MLESLVFGVLIAAVIYSNTRPKFPEVRPYRVLRPQGWSVEHLPWPSSDHPVSQIEPTRVRLWAEAQQGPIERITDIDGKLVWEPKAVRAVQRRSA